VKNWREHAAVGDWDEISYLQLADSELLELKEILSRIVPTRIYGDGLETFRDFIQTTEADSLSEMSATSLLHTIISLLSYKVTPSNGALFREAIALASQVFTEETSIEYKGLRNTYFYLGPKGSYSENRRGHYVEVRSSRAKLIRKRRDEISSDSSSYYHPVTGEYDSRAHVNAQYRWDDAYRWRCVDSLYGNWKSGLFSKNTAVDHAINIFEAHERFREIFQNVTGLKWESYYGTGDIGYYDIGNKGKRAAALLELSEQAFVIGRHYEALLKKPYEEHALSKLQQIEKNRISGKLGGQTDKRNERYANLNRLAQAKTSFAFCNDREGIRLARQLATTYDSCNDPKLFTINGKLLSKDWFSDWLEQFRFLSRKTGS
jgi:hypothetical protein